MEGTDAGQACHVVDVVDAIEFRVEFAYEVEAGAVDEERAEEEGGAPSEQVVWIARRCDLTEEPEAIFARSLEDVAPAVSDIHERMHDFSSVLAHRGQLPLELCWQPDIVMIEEADDRGARRRDPRVPSGRNAPIHAMTNTANARICVMSRELRYLIRRTVID